MNKTAMNTLSIDEIRAHVEQLPQERRNAFWWTIGVIFRCYLEECRAVLLVLDEGSEREIPHLTTTGVNASYDDSFRMVQAAYGMFMDAYKDMDKAREHLQ
jgi:hypothetical protein